MCNDMSNADPSYKVDVSKLSPLKRPLCDARPAEILKNEAGRVVSVSAPLPNDAGYLMVRKVGFGVDNYTQRIVVDYSPISHPSLGAESEGSK